ncbi:hypothetical protein SKAU_G00388460 [Synaphobranchus kaupii]|uniref:Cadherin-13 n=1 Tax=Synaphobranchus kaupii TaxID=118154 RepID=A0A9Q1IDC0_SYNKA|nr:hypothetical protein SKAU_G00388460 [Synaphobranchus kaupii]
MVARSGAQDKAETKCVPGFQLKEYQVEYSGGFQKEVPLLQVHFDDCAGNEGVQFEVSHPGFAVDNDRKLVPREDVVSSGTVMFIHGWSAHADDMAQVDIIGAPPRSPETLREILGLGQVANRTKRSLLVPPMFVPENQRAPFPKFVGMVSVISVDLQNRIFYLTGNGADLEPKGVFSINKMTGEVVVSRPLDRETIAFYHLEVSTTDLSGETLEGPVALDVSVIDQNDNRPIFNETRYAGEVLEGSPVGAARRSCLEPPGDTERQSFGKSSGPVRASSRKSPAGRRPNAQGDTKLVLTGINLPLFNLRRPGWAGACGRQCQR